MFPWGLLQDTVLSTLDVAVQVLRVWGDSLSGTWKVMLSRLLLVSGLPNAPLIAPEPSRLLTTDRATSFIPS